MEKLDYYHEYPCKWFEFCLNVLWPLLIVSVAPFAGAWIEILQL